MTDKYHYTPGSDGCDETFDVWGPDGQFIVSVCFWERRTWAERQAKKIVRMLNRHLPPEWVECTDETVRGRGTVLCEESAAREAAADTIDW